MTGVPFVGLTGGLGAGKSEALRALGDLGAATLSTDAVVHELLASEELRDAVVARPVVEVPLLFESGMEAAFDQTIAVVADEAIRTERAGARGHAAVAERTGRQLSQQEKAKRADFEVRNDGTLEELREKLSRVLARLESPPP